MPEEVQRHLRITTGAMPRYCLIPGNPARFRGSPHGSTAPRRPSETGSSSASAAPSAAPQLASAPPASAARRRPSPWRSWPTSAWTPSSVSAPQLGRQESIPAGSLVVVTGAYGARDVPGLSPSGVPRRGRPAGHHRTDRRGGRAGRAAVRRHRHHARRLPPPGSGPGRAPQQEEAPCRGGTHARRPPWPPSAGTGAGGAVLGIDSNIFLPRREPEEAQRLFREAEARTIGGRSRRCNCWRSGTQRSSLPQPEETGSVVNRDDLYRLGTQPVDDSIVPVHDLSQGLVADLRTTRPGSGNCPMCSTAATRRSASRTAYRGESRATYAVIASISSTAWRVQMTRFTSTVASSLHRAGSCLQHLPDRGRAGP